MRTWKIAELHAHTYASDGDMTPQELVLQAWRYGIQVLSVSDHNTRKSIAPASAVAEKLGMIVVPAIEWTTFYGHLVITGGKSQTDWKTFNPNTADACVAEADRAGDAVTIAHPFRTGWPLCAGGCMQYELKTYAHVHAIEIFSRVRPYSSVTNMRALEWWQARIDGGWHLAPVAGRDWHTPDGIDETPNPYACTCLAMQGNTPADAVAALRRGNAYCTVGVWIDCKLCTADAEYLPGDTVPSGCEAMLYISVTPWKQFPYACKCDMVELRQKGVCTRIDLQSAQNGIAVVLTDAPLCVRMCGQIEGQQATLSILSPFYVQQGENQ